MNEFEVQMIYRFLSGLKESIRDELSMATIWTLSEAKAKLNRYHPLSTTTKRSSNEKPIEKTTHSSTQPHHFPTKPPIKPESSTSQLRNPAKALTQPTNFTLNPYAKPMVRKCYKCNQPGHWSSDYPQRKLATIVVGICKEGGVEEFEDPEDFDGE